MYSYKQFEFEIVLELSDQFDVKQLCACVGISRSGFFKWKKSLGNTSPRAAAFAHNPMLIAEYHKKYPSHGYRWLNAKIRLDTGLFLSDTYAHKLCKTAGITNKEHHRRYRRTGMRYRVYPNLVLHELDITGPMQCMVSDMTTFYFQGRYYELTLCLDLWNNEIIAHSLSHKRGDRMTHINGLKTVLELKGGSALKTILHTDQGTVYAPKAYNELLSTYSIERSMSRAGTPTDNAAIESINGRIRAKLFNDLHLTCDADIIIEIDNYIKFFDEEHSAYALNYLMPKQFKELCA